MESYACLEYVNVENLAKMINSKRLNDVDMNKLTRLKKRLGKNVFHQVKFIPKFKLNKTKGVGRLYPRHNSPSLQDMPREVRKALAYDKYSDLDLVNCHPVISQQLFNKYGISCGALDKYVLNREVCLQETGLPRDEAKELFIKMMYNGKPDSNASEFVKEFHTEFKTASTRLLATADYNIYFKLGDVKKDSNPVGCAMSFVCQDHERQIISQVISTFKECGYETSTLIHDGFHIKSLNIDDEHIQQAKRNVKQITGYDVNITVKPMNDFEPENLWDENCEEMYEAGDHDSAKLFLDWAQEKGHHFVKCKKEIFWYNPEAGVWNDQLEDLRHLIAECDTISRDYRQMANKKDALIKELNVNRDDDFVFNAQQTTYLKLAFKNGVWDFSKNKLVPFSHEYSFFFKAPIEYKAIKNPDVFQKLFVDVFGDEKGKYTLKCFARSLAGEVYDKSLFNVVGEANSGKGCLSTILISAFGEFIGTMLSGVLKIGQQQGDQAKARSWMCPLKNARMIISNEIRMDQELDAALIKTLSGGGDTVVARQNFQNETTFVMQGTCFLFMNDMPKIKGGADEATGNRLRFIGTEYSYLDKDDYERHKNSTYVRKADTTIKSHFIKKKEIIQAFAHLVLSSYCRDKPECPKSVIDDNAEWVGKDDIKIQIQELFTAKPDGIVSLKHLMAACKRQSIEVSTVRIGKILRGYGYEVKDKKVDQYGNPVINETQKSAKSAKCVFGIELQNNNEYDY